MKKSILFVLFALSAIIGNAQTVWAWTSTIPASKRPATSINPSVTALTSPNHIDFVFNVAGTLDNASDSTAYAQIGHAVQQYIRLSLAKQAYGIDTSLAIHTIAVIKKIQRRFAEFEPDDFAHQYVVGTDKFRVWGTFQWKHD